MKKYLYVLTSLVLMSLVSCVNEPFSNEKEHGRETSLVAALGEQVVSVGATVDQLAQIQTEIDNLIENAEEAQAQELSGCKTALQNVVASLESHVDYLKGATWFEGTMATIECQKALASVVASLEIAMGQQFDELESSVSTWVGKDFCMSYSAALALARVQLLGISLNTLSADVTEGLIVAKDSEELAALSVSVAEDAASYAELGTTLDAVVSELTQEYAQAVEAVVVNKTSYDAPALAEYNSNVAVVVKSSTITLNDLVARVSACEAQLESILQAIEDLEADVDGLLGMIQSVAFISDYSSDYAVAYYEMQDTKISDILNPNNGKAERTPVNTIELNYMIRPASVAAALTKENVSVFGYYANKLQPYAVNATSFIDLTVDKVEVIDPTRGLVKVVVKHNLKEEFYFKNIGAKCALSVSTGKTDFVSKFVEIVPKDNSTNVYVESVRINTDDFEVDEGQSKTITATVNPSSATNKTVTWTSSNTEIATIDQYSGVLTAVKQGNVTITATTNGIDEWGNNLTASVNAKVNPSIRLGGPLYVEEGKTAELSLDFPPAMNIESKVWMSSDETKATVENGIVTGVAHTYNQYTYQYNPITITCIVNGNITLTHDMSVAVPQPRQIKLNNYGDDVKSVTMKLDQTISLAGSILPENVDASLFRLTYESDGGLGWIDFNNGEIKAPGSVGGRYVYIKVKDIDKHTYLKTFVERTVVVNVEPYYVESISFADVELQPGANVTLVPTFTSDVSGKQPTTTKLTWESSNNQIATVDENGLVTALGVGDVTITATATDGSGVKGTCKVTITVPWKEFEIGDYVVRKSNGEIEFFTSSTDAKNNGTVVGVVIYKGNPRVSDKKLPESCTHGIAIGLGQGKGKWLSKTPNAEPYHLVGYVNSSYNTADYVSPAGVQGSFTNSTINTLGEKPYGYNNTMLLRAFLELKTDNSSEILTQLNEYNADNNKRTPTGASSWYLPSVYEMYAVYTANNLLNGSLNTILSNVSGTTLTNDNSWAYWTVSEHADSPSSYAVAVNPITGLVFGTFKTTKSIYVRYVFAF